MLVNYGDPSVEGFAAVFGSDDIIVHAGRELFASVSAIPGNRVAFALVQLRTPAVENFHRCGGVEPLYVPGIVYSVVVGGKSIGNLHIGALFCYLYLFGCLAAIGICYS